MKKLLERLKEVDKKVGDTLGEWTWAATIVSASVFCAMVLYAFFGDNE